MDTKKTEQSSGLNILNASEIASSSAEEIDVSGGGGEVIDPKEVAAQAAAEDTAITNDLDTDEPKENEDNDDDTTGNDGDSGISKSGTDEDPGDDGGTGREDEEPTGREGKTGDTPAATEEPEEVETFKVLGQHFSDKGILEGFDEEMENTEEAFEGMIQKTIENGINQYKDNFENPMTKQFIEYLENGGDPGQFMQVMSGPDYSQVTEDILVNSEATQKQVLKAYLMESGESAEEADDTIQAFEDAGSLEKKSKTALSRLQASQIKQREVVMQQQAEAAQTQREQAEAYIADLKTNIEGKEELAGFNLTKKTKTDLFNYITKVGKDGKTDLMRDAENPENQLLMAFFHFNQFDFTKLTKKAKRSATTDLISKLSRHTDTSKKQASRKRTNAPKNEPGSLNLGIMKNIIKKG